MDSWRADAACRGLGPSLFFTDAGDGRGPPLDPGTIALAKAVCGTCAVRTPCLEWALSFPEVFGVWGGTSERERQKMRRARTRGAA